MLGGDNLKNTGIIRRIDDLGRIVIPKEIRKSLHINEGDSLEIYMNKNNEIVFKKHSTINDILKFSNNYAYCLEKYIGHPIIIFDTDNVIIAHGKSKVDLLNLHVEKKLISTLRKKANLSSLSLGDNYFKLPKNLENYTSEFITPILSNGDLAGGICCFSKQSLNESSKLLIKVASSFISKQIE